MPVKDDAAAVRRAVQSLKQAVDALTRHYSDTADVRRLKADVARLDEDIDLLCGSALPRESGQPAPPLEVIPDKEYAHDFWMDAEDEGLGRSEHRPT
jgi:hypothetical protein